MNNLPSIQELDRMVVGNWRLPNTDDEGITMSLYSNGHLNIQISGYSTKRKLNQLFLGDDMSGNWHIRAERIDSDLPNSKILSSSLGSSLELFGSKLNKNENKKVQGPFLILNVTSYPKSILNINIGIRLEIANFFNNIKEIVGDVHHRILSIDQEQLEVEDPKGEIQTWYKIDRNV